MKIHQIGDLKVLVTNYEDEETALLQDVYKCDIWINKGKIVKNREDVNIDLILEQIKTIVKFNL